MQEMESKDFLNLKNFLLLPTRRNRIFEGEFTSYHKLPLSQAFIRYLEKKKNTAKRKFIAGTILC